jgi:hypothetical protein
MAGQGNDAIASDMKDSRIFRRYAVAWAYLAGFVAVQAAYASLSPPAQASFLAWASTSVTNLSHDPVGCLVVSAFVTGGGAWGLVVWVPVIALAMFGANRGVGNWRLIVVCAAGHVAGTLVSEGIVAWRVSSGALPASYRHLIDVVAAVGHLTAIVTAAVVVPLLRPAAWPVTRWWPVRLRRARSGT